jgi:hypothetical protein
MLIRFFHHLFNPHCRECELELECKTCDTLRQLLEEERFEKKKLIEVIVTLTQPKQEVEKEPITIKYEELKPKHVPWRIKKQLLEEEDRKAAELLNNKNKIDEKLEKELLQEVEI